MSGEKTCFVETKGIGRICFGENDVSLLIEPNVVEKIITGIKKNLPYMPEETRQVAMQRITELNDPNILKRQIPYDKINIIGIFESENKKDDPMLALSFKESVSKEFNLSSNIMSFGLPKDDMERVSSSIPKHVKTTDRMEPFWKTVSE